MNILITNKEDRRFSFILFTLSFLLLSYIAYQSPLSADDLEFSRYDFSFSQKLQFTLHYGNGRFLGTIFALLGIHGGIFEALLRALVFTSVIFLLPRVLGLTSKIVYIFSFLLICGMNPRIFAQVFTWMCAFINYVPPIILTLLILYTYQRAHSFSGIRYHLAAAAVFLMGTASQLFVEHNTLFQIFLAALTVVHAWFLKGGDRRISATWLIATLLGGCIMFAIPKLFYIPDNHTVGYREFMSGGLRDILSTAIDNFTELYDYLIACHAALIVLVFCAGILMYHCKLTRKCKPHLFILALLFLVSYFCDLGFWDGAFGLLQKLLLMIRNLYLIILCFYIIFCAANSQQKNKLLLLGVLFLCALAPLLVVSPIAERGGFLGYLCFVGSLLIGIEITKQYLSADTMKSLLKSACAISLALSILLISVYTWIGHLEDIRLYHLETQMQTGTNEIHIFLIPSNYAYGAAELSYERCYYREEWCDIEIIIDPIDQWMAQYGVK